MEWATDAVERQFIRRPPEHGAGNIYRRGEETVQEALARDLAAVQAKASASRARETKAAGERPKGKGRPPDPTPPKQPSQPKPAGPTSQQLAASVELVLGSGGALWGRYVLGCDYCATSLRDTAPAAARDLVKLAEKNAPLKALLTRWHLLVSTLMVGQGVEGLILWAGRPIVHHAIPEPIAGIVSPILGVPARQPAQPRQQAHQHPPQAQPRPAPHQATDQPPTPAPAEQNGTPSEDAAAQAAERELARMNAAAEQQRAEQIAAAERELARIRMMEAEAQRQAARTQPHYAPNSAQERAQRAPGPQAPEPPAGATDAGSPLPPEA